MHSCLPLVCWCFWKEASSVQSGWDPFSPRNAAIGGHSGTAGGTLWHMRRGEEGGIADGGAGEKALSDLASPGREQGGIDDPCALEGLGIDRDVDQRIEPTHRAHVARLGSFDAQVLG